MTIAIYDTTLRDGTQREGISLSVADKLKITRLLDQFGVAYIEGGWPGSNPKDAAFFQPQRRSFLRGSPGTGPEARQNRRIRFNLPQEQRPGDGPQYHRAGGCSNARRDGRRQNLNAACD